MGVSPAAIAEQVFDALDNDYAGFAAHDDGGWWRALARRMAASGQLSESRLYQLVLRRVAALDDPAVRFLPGPGSAAGRTWCGFSARRLGDDLLVTRVQGDERMRVGDVLTRVDGCTPDEFAARIAGASAPGGPLPAGRQDWGALLPFASRARVRRADGTERDFRLRSFPKPDEDLDPCELRFLDDGTAVLRVTQLDDDRAARLLQAQADLVRRAPRLVIDLRTCSGGMESNAYPLLGHLFSHDTTLAEVLGDEEVLTNYTQANCGRRERQVEQLRVLAAVRPGEGGPDLEAWVDQSLAAVRAHRGQGMVRETVECDDVAVPAGPQGQRVLVLTDFATADAAEWLARLAARSDRATLVGRATRGSLDFANAVSISFDDRFVLVYPMSMTAAASRREGTRGRGVAPQVEVPLTARECVDDVVLERALAL